MTEPISRPASRTRDYHPEADSAEASSRSSAAAARGSAEKKKAGAAERSSRKAFEQMPHGEGVSPDALAGMVRARRSTSPPAPTTTAPASAPGKAAPASAAEEAAKLYEAALRSANAQRHAVQQLNYAVARASDQVRSIHPFAERSLGVAQMATAGGVLLVGLVKSAVKADSTDISHAADEADRAVSYAAGELGDRIDEANAAHAVYRKQSNAYEDAFQRYTTALRNGDYAAAAGARKQMDDLVPQMKESADRFATLAASVGNKSKKFDGDVVRTAIHLHASALTVGGFAGAAGGAVSHGAMHFAEDVAKHMAVDGLVGEAMTAPLGEEH